MIWCLSFLMKCYFKCKISFHSFTPNWFIQNQWNIFSNSSFISRHIYLLFLNILCIVDVKVSGFVAFSMSTVTKWSFSMFNLFQRNFHNIPITSTNRKPHRHIPTMLSNSKKHSVRCFVYGLRLCKWNGILRAYDVRPEMDHPHWQFIKLYVTIELNNYRLTKMKRYEWYLHYIIIYQMV